MGTVHNQGCPLDRELKIQDSSSGIGTQQTDPGDRQLLSVLGRLFRDCCCRESIWSKGQGGKSEKHCHLRVSQRKRKTSLQKEQ